MIQNSFYIETYGCASNKADSQIISKILKDNNYIPTSISEAQFIIINTCAVKQQTENKIKERLKELYSAYQENKEKNIIIAGCLPYVGDNYFELIERLVPNYSAILDLDNFEEIPSIIEQIKVGNRNIFVPSKKSIDKSKYLIDDLEGKITGIVPISEGCLGACTYCCVKNARGRLNCYDPESIVKNVEYQLKQGIKQVYLTSQDCSTYNHGNTSLQDLVQSITNLDFQFFLRVGMLNPKFLIDEYEQLLSIYGLKNVYQFLHVPIQSGSDDVLKLMNRPYTMGDIKEKLKILREKLPYLTISTDIICGFPGETKDDFQDTIDLIRWLKPEILNISKFTPRPGTKAKKMIQVNSREIKKRSIELSNVFRDSLSNLNDKWKNWEGKVLALHTGTGKNQTFGRNFAYKNIFIDKFNGKLGTFAMVRINDIDGFNLNAQIID
ncbi:MAG: tRNA (N(6)-L-threonylcarbamoyladenosine(37)-C(2))-methylthiotransferase [Candidatus Lokiarchaeota archaeon]|nr:tRNA (N(6)-L-threonylcarbamoyladenosine(37)-C(2))-methylthiotransferase [Candidatus Lokiarchaeota archaeon]